MPTLRQLVHQRVVLELGIPDTLNVSPGLTPTASNAVAYGNAELVQIFSSYQDADQALLDQARQLCLEHGRPNAPALISIAGDTLYISPAPGSTK
jgi:hypothetical protein